MLREKYLQTYSRALLEDEIEAIRKVLTEFDGGRNPQITINGVQLSGYGVCRATANHVCRAIRYELEQDLAYLKCEKERF